MYQIKTFFSICRDELVEMANEWLAENSNIDVIQIVAREDDGDIGSCWYSLTILFKRPLTQTVRPPCSPTSSAPS